MEGNKIKISALYSVFLTTMKANIIFANKILRAYWWQRGFRVNEDIHILSSGKEEDVVSFPPLEIIHEAFFKCT